jgi:amino acid adenylation domain-containing protein
MGQQTMSEQNHLAPDSSPILSFAGPTPPLADPNVPATRTIARRSNADPAPLSFAQQRLWFLEQLEPRSVAYSVGQFMRLTGDLKLDALQRALSEIVARHESIRTTFAAVDAKPVQVIASSANVPLAVEDLSHLPVPDRPIEAQRRVADELNRPFDLSVGPLLRARLYRLNQQEHLLLLCSHHIISDKWSRDIYQRELSALYDAYSQGQPSPLPELPIQYADYAIWQREWLQGEVLQQQLSIWKKKLGGELPILKLPTDRPRPRVQTYRGARESIVLPPVLVDLLTLLGCKESVTLYMTLLAAFKALLHRTTGLEDILVSSTIAGRNRIETESLIGFFANTLVLRTSLAGDPTFRELLGRVRQTCLDACANQDLPFEKLVEELQPERNQCHPPLFQTMFNLQDVPRQEIRLPGLTISDLDIERATARFDVTFLLAPTDKGLGLDVEYNIDLFDGSTIQRMLQHYRNLLEGIAANPDLRISNVPLLTEAETRQLLIEWNDTKTEYPSDKCIHELFEEQVERTPAAVAVVHEERELSYGELNTRANQLAHYLRELGVKPDGRVAICVERGIEMVVSLLAVLKAGGAYVPLDPAYPAERLKYMLEDSAPTVLLTQGRLKEMFAGRSNALAVIDLATNTPQWADQPESNPDRAGVGLTPRHLVYVIYTSGSTGTPKGVMAEHRGLQNLLQWYTKESNLSSGDVVLVVTSYSFDLTQRNIFGTLIVGGLLYLAKEPFDAQAIVTLVTRERISIMNLTPSAFHTLIDCSVKGELGRVRTVILGGEVIDSSRLLKLVKPWPEFFNCYGPTECTGVVVFYRMSPDLEQYRNRSVPLGRPIANARIYILDGHGQPVPIGVAGEIYIGGVGVARGYLNRPELTAERFVRDPFTPEAGARMYKTGDLGRWLPDGTIEFLGRNDFQVKVRGYRIELGEIEARLREHAGVREAVVLAQEDSAGDKRLVTYYTGVETVGAEELGRHLTERLPEYMVPAAYVRLKALPLTPNGKLDRKALPVPKADAYAVRGYEAPQGEVETILAAIWADVLKVERVGRHDNFFELGGHSLLAVTLIQRMRQKGLHTDVRALFSAPTLAGLAAGVGGGASVVDVPPNLIPPQCDAITPEMLPLVKLSTTEIGRIVGGVPGGARNVQDIYPLAPLQDGILFHHLMATKGDPYLLSSLYSFDNRARLDGYLAALQAVMDRHDILRTAVVWEGLREPVQVVWRKAPMPVEEVQFDPADGDMAEQLKRRFDPRHHRVDVRQAPLIHAWVAQDTANERWLLLLLSHHLASDHTTMGVMQEEIQAHLLGQADQLPRPLPFRNLVAQARLGVSQEEHEAFFRKLLGDVDEPTAPFGLLDVQGDGSGIEEASLEVDANLARRLRDHARKLGVSAATLFHLAWAQVLARVSGREDVVFGTVLFGRMQACEGADRALGLFMNTLPVPIRVGEESVESSARATHTQLADLLRHEHASLALAQRCSAVPASAPLFSALLNYRHSPSMAQAPSAEAMQAWEGIDLLYEGERTNYPFTLSVDDLGEGFVLTAQVSAVIGPMRVCEFMHTALEGLVEALEKTPAKATHSIDVLPEAERRQVLEEWNDTKAEYPRDQCVHEVFEMQALRTPEAIAVEDGERRLTYHELNSRADGLSQRLRTFGVREDVLVGLCVERSIEMIVAMLGILKAGGACVPLDPTYPTERLAFMLEDTKTPVLVTERRFMDRFSGAHTRIIFLDDPRTEAVETNPPRTHPHSESLAYVFYTSGSEGRPKGVCIPHRTINRLVCNTNFVQIVSSDCVAQVSNASFDGATFEIWGALLNGARLVMISRDTALSPRELAEQIQRRGITTMFLTTSLFNELALQAPSMFRALKHLVIGGEAADPKSVRMVLRSQSPQRLVNGYGPTEATTFATWYEMKDVPDDDQSIPIGRPLANTKAYILDAQLRPVPIRVAGELHIGGDALARGYWNRPELTAEKFIANPFTNEPGDRLYKTGDLARYRADGNIEFLGRIDQQVKVRGYRIELGEIEVALARHESVRTAVVTVRQESPADQRIIAYVVPDGANAPTAGDLRAFLLQKLPDYMVPSAFVLVRELPLTPNGKVDRKALPLADQALSLEERNVVVPRTPVELALAKLWCDLLKITNVGVHDNFFEVGGHSLLATQLVSRIRREFNVELPLRNVFEGPTIESLALSILENQTRTTDPDELEKMLAEIESLSDETAARQLLEAGQNAPDVPPDEEGPTRQRTVSIFRCPTTKSELFGRRDCNLVILINEDFEWEGFERVAHLVRELDPTIDARLVRDGDAPGLVLPQRPTLTFSPAAIRHYPPQPGRVFCGYPLGKSEECEALVRAGITVPKWVLLTEDQQPDLSDFNGYVVRKPNYGGRSEEVRLMRKERVRWKPVTTHAAGTSDSVIIQQFIYTGPLPTSYRVCTLFGRALYSMKSQAGADHPRLTTPADVASALKQERFTISANGRDGRPELNFDEEIIRLGERAHAAFPDIPLLGFDIVREVPSGRLYVLEANAIGYVWNFQSQQLADYGFSFEEQFDGIRKAAYVLAENTQLHAR